MSAKAVRSRLAQSSCRRRPSARCSSRWPSKTRDAVAAWLSTAHLKK